MSPQKKPVLGILLKVLSALAFTLMAAGLKVVSADYPTGDSCLFCHRNEIGATWLVNAHAWTIRPVGEPPAIAGKTPADATHVIGRDFYRVLKQTGYGKFSLLQIGGDDGQRRPEIGHHLAAENSPNRPHDVLQADGEPFGRQVR